LDYPTQDTDHRGLFTNTVAGLPLGSYRWRVKGPKYLANSGIISLTGARITNVEMGLLRVGDCDNDNVVGITDFNILRLTFGRSVGQSGYDDRANFDGNQVVNIFDFNLLRANFGRGGSPPISPGGR
jgi:hypothetical protein